MRRQGRMGSSSRSSGRFPGFPVLILGDSHKAQRRPSFDAIRQVMQQQEREQEPAFPIAEEKENKENKPRLENAALLKAREEPSEHTEVLLAPATRAEQKSAKVRFSLPAENDELLSFISSSAAESATGTEKGASRKKKVHFNLPAEDEQEQELEWSFPNAASDGFNGLCIKGSSIRTSIDNSKIINSSSSSNNSSSNKIINSSSSSSSNNSSSSRSSSSINSILKSSSINSIHKSSSSSSSSLFRSRRELLGSKMGTPTSCGKINPSGNSAAEANASLWERRKIPTPQPLRLEEH